MGTPVCADPQLPVKNTKLGVGFPASLTAVSYGGVSLLRRLGAFGFAARTDFSVGGSLAPYPGHWGCLPGSESIAGVQRFQCWPEQLSMALPENGNPVLFSW